MRLSAINSSAGAAYFSASFSLEKMPESTSTSSSSKRKATFIRSWTMNGSQSSWTKLGYKCESAFKHILFLLVGIYRMIGAPVMGGACRFEPSCSEYALHALETHHPLRATWLITKRLCKCRPFGPQGFD